MTFHMIPWMWGVEGDKTCGISDTIVITEDGCRSFFTMDRDFVVKTEGTKPQSVELSAVTQPTEPDPEPEPVLLPPERSSKKSGKTASSS